MLRPSLFNSVAIPMLAVSIFSLTGCGTEEPATDPNAIVMDDDYYEFQDLILTKYEIPAVISLPDETASIGASTRPEVIHDESFKWEINVGPNFKMHIEDCADIKGLIKDQKMRLADQKFFKINYLIDNEDMILYERTLVVGGSEKASPKVGVLHKTYHIYGQKKIGNVVYALYSGEDGFEKRIIELMAKSIRSFKPIKSKG